MHAARCPLTEQQAAGRNFGHCEQLQETKTHQGKPAILRTMGSKFRRGAAAPHPCSNAHPRQPLQLAAAVWESVISSRGGRKEAIRCQRKTKSDSLVRKVVLTHRQRLWGGEEEDDACWMAHARELSLGGLVVFLRVRGRGGWSVSVACWLRLLRRVFSVVCLDRLSSAVWFPCRTVYILIYYISCLPAHPASKLGRT
jgi:hypothetical protein